MKCPNCNSEPAITHPTFGILVGKKCKARRDKLKSPSNLYEFTSKSIKSERKEYAKDIVQPYRGNEASKEFIEAYPEKAKRMFTKREIRMARNVWK